MSASCAFQKDSNPPLAFLQRMKIIQYIGGRVKRG
jgi:hypothetical protein